MRVMILGNDDVGLYKFRKELIEKLREENEVYICVPKGEFVSYFVDLGCKFVPCKLLDRHGTNPIKELRLVFWYKNVLKKCKPDIVFSYTIKPNIYGGIACQSLQIPYVINVTGLGTAVENGGLMQVIALTLYKKGMKGAQKIFFQNIENRDFMLKRNIVRESYDLIPGSGVNLDEYKVLDYPKKETVEFAFIARIMKEKGIDQYLEAAEYIKEKYPKTKFHVCGPCEQNYKEKLENLQNRGIIIYHGLVKNIILIHRISSCTIHPTYYPEGISNVLLESCACGRPIITTNRSGCREVVEDGINGYIVEEKNGKDLVEKIEKFLNLSVDSRCKMGIAGRRKVEREFDRRIVVDKYMAELRKNENIDQ